MSWSATDMLASAARPIVYGSQGGIEPATMEWLVIERSGSARYFAANPWPRSRPYDEIGTYAGRLPDTAHAELLRLAGELTGAANGGEASPDTGLEYLDVLAEGATWSGEWTAQRTPGGARPIVHRLRAAIDGLRNQPLRTLHAALMVADGTARLRLANRGTEPFAFTAFGEHGSGVHARIYAGSAERAGVPGERPIDRLADDAPVRLSASPRIAVTSPSGLSVAAGSWLDLPLDVPAHDGRLECLVHVRFETESLAGERYTEDGWIWPRAITMGDA